MYRGVTLRLYHVLDRARVTATLQRLRAVGADAVSIVPHQYCVVDNTNAHPVLPAPPAVRTRPDQYVFADRDEGGTLGIGLVGNTTPPDDVRFVCQQAHDLGFTVLLKPHIDPLRLEPTDHHYYPAGWRGYINIDAVVDAFRRSYCEDFLATYVQIAKDLQLPLFSIGVEYYWIAHQQAAPFWTAVADWVAAQGYAGQLVYSANWGWGGDAEFQRLAALWQHPRLSFIGIDAYYPLWPIQLTDTILHTGGWSPAPGTPDADPTLDQLVSGWTQPHRMPDGSPIDVAPVDALTALSRATGKPLLFTEIGYSNRYGANWDPGRDANPQDQIADPTQPGCLQVRLFEAFKRVWAPAPAFAGFFWWEAWLSAGQDPRTIVTHNVLGTHLEGLLFTEMAAPPPAPAIAKHGVYGPNSRFADAQNPWTRLISTQAGWLKLLYNSQFPTHTRADAQQARAAGLRLLVRTTSRAADMMPIPEEVTGALAEFAGLAAVIEVGAAPPQTATDESGHALTRWDHALRMEEMAHNQGPAARAAGIALCTPGWSTGDDPPDGGDSLAQRLRAVYNLYDAIGVQVFDPTDLGAPAVLQHLARWHACFPAKPIYITEYGIAARAFPLPASGSGTDGVDAANALEKVRRYARFLHAVQRLDYVTAAFLFILGGTHDWEQLPGHPDQGYWLPDAAWAAFPAAVRALPP